jgi:hypothetical protein
LRRSFRSSSRRTTIQPGLIQFILGSAGKEECRGKIGVEHLAPFGERELTQRLAHHDSRIGDEAVQPPEPIEDGAYRTSRGLLGADVALDERAVTTVPGIAALEAGAGQIDRADAPAFAQQPLRNGKPDPVRRGGDDRDGSFR